ncbi:MAG: hypothetical protein C0501_17310 [Isosphaera sp.]|nr:hypothetical protein [Isosphaera sp.]
MNRAWVPAGRCDRRTFLALSAAGLGALAGCKGTEAEKAKVGVRGQVAEDPGDDGTAVLGGKTTIGNTEPIQVSGVGLVVDLPGTGSSPPPGGWRAMLEDSLKKTPGLPIKALLDDPGRTTSLVLVTALIPPGARKGDPVDIQVTLPDDSKTTSLKGGKLFPCKLFNTDTTGNIRSLVRDGRPAGPSGEIRKGDVWAEAEGAVLAGQFVPAGGGQAAPEADADGNPVYKVGRVWGGGKVTRSRPYFVLINPGSQSPQMAAALAERLNTTFHTTAEPNLKVADAKSRELILVNVPVAYRNNHYRFLLVARQVPIDAPAADGLYRRKLEEELQEPATAVAAAIKLEALGAGSLKALRVGLNNPSPWVRFASAEALTHLGQADGAAELARLAEAHVALRAPCLKALSAMDDAACTDRLVELAGAPDPALRYGAFLALRLADESNPAAKGRLVNGSFWLHQVAPGSTGMIHLTADRRCEVVLFGDAPKFRGPFTLPVGTDFTVHVPGGGAGATVTRIVKVRGELEEKKLPCKSAEVAEVLAAVGRLGGGYAEAVELVRRADRAQVLSAPVHIDAVPGELSVTQLTEFARTDPALAKADAAVARAGVVRPDLDANGFDLPPDPPDPAAQVPAPPPRPPLNREPGRIFGPKRYDAPPPADPVRPAGQ